ncbi:MAG TPA: hypothetical protein VFA89_10835 [Terriglobales bacterium]|nr:hypothetical protein [Terriglobales bacterium]
MILPNTTFLTSAQTLQQHTQQRRIGAAFDPHLCLPQFDVNRAAALGLRHRGETRLGGLDYNRR